MEGEGDVVGHLLLSTKVCIVMTVRDWYTYVRTQIHKQSQLIRNLSVCKNKHSKYIAVHPCICEPEVLRNHIYSSWYSQLCRQLVTEKLLGLAIWEKG